MKVATQKMTYDDPAQIHMPVAAIRSILTGMDHINRAMITYHKTKPGMINNGSVAFILNIIEAALPDLSQNDQEILADISLLNILGHCDTLRDYNGYVNQLMDYFGPHVHWSTVQMDHMGIKYNV